MTLKYKFTYRLLNVMARQIRRLPYLSRLRLSNKLGAFAYNRLTIRKQEAFNNIKKAFPDKSNNWINNVLKKNLQFSSFKFFRIFGSPCIYKIYKF